MTDEQKYLLYLINRAVRGQSAELPDFEINWGEFAKYAEEQQFEQIIYPLLKDKKTNMEPQLWHHLHQRYGRAVVRDTNQDLALDEICGALSEAGIPHIPLKGSVLKKYYPLPELRYSCDLDILVHENDMPKADAVLEQLGFCADTKDLGIHDIFSRGKIHIELHKSLLHADNKSFAFCSEVWEHSRKRTGMTYEIEEEFLYVYMLAHLRKHILLSGGAGIKLILDIYVMRNFMELDREKLNSYCKAASMENFNQCMVRLEQKWFEMRDCNNENVSITEDIILNSGAYADYSVYMKMLMSERTDSDGAGNKSGKFARYLFPSAKTLKGKYKILEKHPYLLPVMWGVRFMTTQREKAAEAIAAFKSLEKEESARINRYVNDMRR